MSGQLHTLGIMPMYSLNRGIDGHQSWLKHSEEEENILALPGIGS